MTLTAINSAPVPNRADRIIFSGAGYALVRFGEWRPGNAQGRLPNGQRFVPRYGTPRTTDDIMTVELSCLRPAPDSLSPLCVA